METASFASRRHAAASLPNFSLPPPDIPSTRYPNHHVPAIISPNSNDSHVGPREASTAAASSSIAAAAPPTTSSSHPHPHSHAITSSSSQPTPISYSTSRTTTLPSSSSILTPTSGIASDGLSPSSGGNSGSSQSSQPGGPLYYSNHMSTGSWPPQGPSQNSAYTYANPSSASGSSPVVPQSFSRQSVFPAVSPSIPQFPGRNSSSTNGDNLPHPPTYHEQSFPTPIGPGGPSLGSTYSQAPGPSQHPALSQPILSSQNPSGTQPPTSTHQAGTPGGPQPGQEGAPYRAPPTPNTYYPPSSTPQQSSFPAFPGQPHQSPTTHSPTTSTGGSSRGLHALSSGMAPPLSYGQGRHHTPSVGPYPQSPYQMPVLSNVHHPGAPLSMVGGMPGLSAYHSMSQHGHHHLYSPHGTPQGDRPFRCDECPQSFNRNHDLKRHKRIHLAVKPFPCHHCDKSFSRKDALKRHKLVKGCGSTSGRNDGATGTERGSPPDRSPVISEDTGDNVTPKREPL